MSRQMEDYSESELVAEAVSHLRVVDRSSLSKLAKLFEVDMKLMESFYLSLLSEGTMLPPLVLIGGSN